MIINHNKDKRCLIRQNNKGENNYGKYINKKVVIREKIFETVSSTNMPMNNKLNTLIGVITDTIDNRFIELDEKKLIAIDYIYTIEITN